MSRHCLPPVPAHDRSEEEDEPTAVVRAILWGHDPAPLTEAFLRVLAELEEEAPRTRYVDRSKAARFLYVCLGGRGRLVNFLDMRVSLGDSTYHPSHPLAHKDAHAYTRIPIHRMATTGWAGAASRTSWAPTCRTGPRPPCRRSWA